MYNSTITFTLDTICPWQVYLSFASLMPFQGRIESARISYAGDIRCNTNILADRPQDLSGKTQVRAKQ